MNSFEKFIQNVRKHLPELASSKDLVRVGIYRTEQAAYNARKNGTCPTYIELPCRGIVYPRQGVIEFLKRQVRINEESEMEVEPACQSAQISHSKVPPLRQKV